MGYQFDTRTSINGLYHRDFWSHAPEAPRPIETRVTREVMLGEPEPDLEGVGRYSIVRYLRSGESGDVYLAARDGDPAQMVALRCLRPDLRLHVGCQKLTAVRHKHLARVLECGTISLHRNFLALEYLEGRTLIESCFDRRLTLTGRSRLFALVCAAVEHIHAQGIVHNGINALNIRIDSAGDPKLTGIELAREIRDSGRCAVASDVYMLGLVLYELLSGILPPERGAIERPSTCLARLDMAAFSPIASQRRMAPEAMMLIFDGGLDQVVMRALDENPSLRYPSAYALSQAVRGTIAQFR